MAITKKYLKSKPICKVTFELPKPEAEKASIVGSFNDWDPAATPLKKLKSGTFKATVDLPKDSNYEFKYFVEGEYINDEAADDYQWNDFAGSENGILVL